MTPRAQLAEDRAEQQRWRASVRAACAALDAHLYPDSLTVSDGLAFALVRRGLEKYLLVLYQNESRAAAFAGTHTASAVHHTRSGVKLCPLTHQNAAAIRGHLPFTAPVALSQGRSIGTGDRLGLATPGHVRALRRGSMKPVLAQQSVREMTRTQRSVNDVLDDVTWGVLQAGYREGFAADADHLKTTSDIEHALEAGFTMYTIDPSDYVDGSADDAAPSDLAARLAALPWDALCSTPDDCRRAYANRTFTVQGDRDAFRLRITPEEVLRAAVKYGRAIGRIAATYRHLASRWPRERYTFEVSVDESDAPTSTVEHFYIASELRRLGVRWDGLAPRFVGHFYKGVDYVGDPARFRTEFAKHVLVAQHFGSYKISLHSGSDKFAIYPIVAELAGDLIHVKTAGTSYVEALRLVAHAAPALFREILRFVKQRYRADKATYHVSADVRRVAEPDDVRDADLPALLDQWDTRQVCHVTYGSVLTTRAADGRFLFRDDFFALLKRNEEPHYRLLEEHFLRHLHPFR
ncbi:MAG: tagaturonate epimerase family protein [Phycisphaerae bacterium]